MFGFQWTRKTPKGYAPLAQLVEQLTLNQWVRGSSPRRCTKSGNRVPKSVFLSQRVHPFPFRTRKLSSAEPKILAWRRAGTIGHCRHLARATVLAAKGNMGMHSDTPLVSLYFYSSLAQSVERVTVNHDVAGSSPAGGAISFNQKGNSQKDHKILWSFCYSKAVFLNILCIGTQNCLTFFQ